MPLSPRVARVLPEKLRVFCVGLRYPHVFLASIPVFIAALLLSRHIPYAEQVLMGIGLVMFVTSKLR